MCSHTHLEQVSEHYGGDDADNGEVGCVKPKYGHVYYRLLLRMIALVCKDNELDIQ